MIIESKISIYFFRIAKNSTLLFFSLKDLCVINCMYRYGLDWFNYFLSKAFENKGVYKTFQERLDDTLIFTKNSFNFFFQCINDLITYSIF